MLPCDKNRNRDDVRAHPIPPSSPIPEHRLFADLSIDRRRRVHPQLGFMLRSCCYRCSCCYYCYCCACDAGESSFFEATAPLNGWPLRFLSWFVCLFVVALSLPRAHGSAQEEARFFFSEGFGQCSSACDNRFCSSVPPCCSIIVLLLLEWRRSSCTNCFCSSRSVVSFLEKEKEAEEEEGICLSKSHLFQMLLCCKIQCQDCLSVYLSVWLCILSERSDWFFFSFVAEFSFFLCVCDQYPNTKCFAGFVCNPSKYEFFFLVWCFCMWKMLMMMMMMICVMMEKKNVPHKRCFVCLNHPVPACRSERETLAQVLCRSLSVVGW